MTHVHRFTIVALAAGLAACGASASSEPSTSLAEPHERAGTMEAKPGDSQQPSTLTAPIAYGAHPSLSVYVEGPKPIGGQSGIDATAGAYQTEITIVNEGEAPAEVEQARVWFEVWHGEQRLPCAQERFFEAPPTLEPGESHTFQVRAGCPLPEPGEYEVRAYLAFGAEGEGIDLERYFAGRYFVDTAE